MERHEIDEIEFDTEGHSLLGLELGNTMNQDRERSTAKLLRDSAQRHEAHLAEPDGSPSWFARWRERAWSTTSRIQEKSRKAEAKDPRPGNVAARS